MVGGLRLLDRCSLSIADSYVVLVYAYAESLMELESPEGLKTDQIQEMTPTFSSRRCYCSPQSTYLGETNTSFIEGVPVAIQDIR